jgi:hypothetical protein
MPLARYGVLAGRVVDRKAEGGTDTPHYQVQVAAGGEQFRVAVNVLSKEHPSELLYLADEAFHHPIVQDLLALPEGFSSLPSMPGGLALDFIRANLFDRTLLRAVPATAPGPDNDLADKLDHFVERAEADPLRHGTPTTRPGTPSPAPDLAGRRRRITRSGSSPRWSTRSARHPKPRRSPWSMPALRTSIWPAGRSLIRRSGSWSWRADCWPRGTQSGSTSGRQSRSATAAD